jgi:hypothetical protein
MTLTDTATDTEQAMTVPRDDDCGKRQVGKDERGIKANL